MRLRVPLFVCQIDFEKAFDKVPRALLWRRLEDRGVHGSMLAALQAAYQRVLLRVKVNGKLGPAFASVQGVKQGCPMSPTLLGFFVEIMAEYLGVKDRNDSERMRPWEAATTTFRRVPLLFYADDLSLLCTSPGGLRNVLSVLTVFCEAFGMRVIASKSEVMVFHRDLMYASVCKDDTSFSLQVGSFRTSPVCGTLACTLVPAVRLPAVLPNFMRGAAGPCLP
jgi:hypothetical protein